LLKQLVIGSLVIAVTVAIHAEMFNIFNHRFEDLMLAARRRIKRFANTGVIMISVLYILLVHTIEVWLWAFVLLLTGAQTELEPAVYFALVSFTTVGFGDIVLSHEWRLLSALIAANGFILFGWSVAYMVELVRKTA
jgi:hypothetical protein